MFRDPPPPPSFPPHVHGLRQQYRIRLPFTGCADGITCHSDQEVVEKLAKVVGKAPPANSSGKFVWGQLRGVSDFYEQRVSRQRQDAAAQRARAEVEGALPSSGATAPPGKRSTARWAKGGGSFARVRGLEPTVLCISSDPPHICSHLKINGAIETSFGVQAPYCP